MKKTLRWLVLILAVLTAALLVYLAAVLMTIGERDEHTPLAPEAGVTEETRIIRDTSPQVLADAFGADLFVFADQAILSGVTANANHAGRNCRTLTVSFACGATLFCVRPASAAPLIRPSGMEIINAGELSVCNLPAVIGRSGELWCVYFSGEDASYSITGPSEGRAEWLQLLSTLSAVSPSAAE